MYGVYKNIHKKIKLSPDNRLVIASHNRGKLKEFELLLARFSLNLISASELKLASPLEDGSNFAENAKIKSDYVTQQTGLAALADDSGLVIDALNGSPGIYSARWAGKEQDFNKAMNKILKLLDEKNMHNTKERRAHFVCALSFSSLHSETKIFLGQLSGHIADKSSGSQGFGYDPIFIADNQSKTLGETHPYEKQALSHRRKAFDKLICYLSKNYAP